MKLIEFADQPMQTTTLKRYYYVYCRKSTESDDRQAASIEDQEQVLAELASKLNLPILKTYRESKSAKAPGRPIYNEMMASIHKRNDIKGIICWKLNRLSRNPKDSGDLQWLIQSHVIDEVVTPNQRFTVRDTDFIMSIEGAKDSRFIKDLSEDTLRGLEKKLNKGVFPGRAPVGYRNTLEKPQGLKDIEPHPVYFTLMRKIFELALTNDYSILDLCYRAKELGIRMQNGKPLSRTRMYETLRSPFYTGRFIYRGLLHQGIHTPMISDAEFDLLQDFVASRSRFHTRDNLAVFNGFIRCGYCGYMICNENINKKYKNGTVQQFNYYRCTQKRKPSKCQQPYIRADELDAQVGAFLSRVELAPKFVSWAIKELNRTSESEKALREAKYQAIKASFDGVQQRIQNLFTMRISPENTNQELITDAEYREARQNLLMERQDIQDKLDNHVNYSDNFDELVVKTFDFTTKAVDKWKNGTYNDKRMVLSVIGTTMNLKDGVLTIEPRTPFLLIEKALKKHWFEPTNQTQSTPRLSDMSVMGPLANSVRTYYTGLPEPELEAYRVLLLQDNLLGQMRLSY